MNHSSVRWVLGWSVLVLTWKASLAVELPAAPPPFPEQAEIAAGPFRPTEESLKQYKYPEWFRDAKLGIWAVWGPESVPEQGDWYARRLYEAGDAAHKFHVTHYGHPSKFGFKDIIPLWKAERWDPDRLMALYKKAGARYFCMIAEHHDNFDCWNSTVPAVEFGQHGAEARHRRPVAGGRQEARAPLRHDRTPGCKLVVLRRGEGLGQDGPAGRGPLRRRRSEIRRTLLDRQPAGQGVLRCRGPGRSPADLVLPDPAT